MKKLIITLLTSIFCFSIPMQMAFADETTAEPKAPEIKLENVTNLSETTFDVGILSLDDENQKNGFFADTNYPPVVNLLISVINFAVKIMGSIAVLLMIVAGFMMIFAQGEQATVDSAKETVKYAIIGLVITLLSYTIVIAIQSIFNSA